ncbi:hypothetical protein PENSPDRAFT_344999 [Peniophora sp. CONT]|nr:hypothetical protein PENSPDRAFT_344999 [Peniophora sp. CONT]
MADSTASRKRQRTDEPAVKPEPSSEEEELPAQATLLPLYYDDGNVIIEARAHFSAAELDALARDGCNANQLLADALQSIPEEGLDGLVKYKIHRGILASHSTVFADYFRGKETILGGCEEEYEGGIIFTLPDERSGLDAFLKAMYLPGDLQKRYAQSVGTNIVPLLSNVLSLCDKYNSPSIRSIVVGLLERRYPSNLSHCNLDRDKFSQSELVVYGAVLRLAMQHKIGSIMPLLLYRLGAALRGLDTVNYQNNQAIYGRIVTQLTAQDLRILFGGSLTLHTQSDRRLAKLATLEESPVCMRPEPHRLMRLCTAALSSSIRPAYAMPNAPSFVYYARNALDLFDQAVIAISNSNDICPECKKVFTQETKAAKLQLWKDIPRIFNVVDLVGEGWGSE